MLSSMTTWRYAAFCIPREIWINCSAIDRLIMVYRMGVIPSGLLIVASLIQCLPVRTIPEELRVSLVWNDMVHNRRRCCFSFLQALLAEWMKCQELLALPSHLAPYPLVAAERLSSGCKALCSSQYFCPAGTRFGQQGCLHGTFGLYGMSVTSVPDFSHVKILEIRSDIWFPWKRIRGMIFGKVVGSFRGGRDEEISWLVIARFPGGSDGGPGRLAVHGQNFRSDHRKSRG